MFHKISDKQIRGKKLDPTEQAVWNTAADLLVISLRAGLCHTFFAPVEEANAICCELNVVKKFGFCTLSEFVGAVVPGTGRWFTQLTNSAQTATATATTTPAPKKDKDTIYVNLFDIPCKPRVDDFLCSQYVREAVF